MVGIDSFNLRMVKARLQDNKFPKVSCLAMEPELKAKSVGFEAEVLSCMPYCSALLEHVGEGWAVSSIFQQQLSSLPCPCLQLLPIPSASTLQIFNCSLKGGIIYSPKSIWAEKEELPSTCHWGITECHHFDFYCTCLGINTVVNMLSCLAV